MNKKLIFIIIGIIILAMVLAIVFLSKSTLIIKTNPSQNVQISIDGQKVSANGEIKLKSGTYDIKIESPEYIPYQKNIKLGMFAKKELSVNLKKLSVPQKAVEYQVQYTILSSDKKSLYYLSNNGKTMYEITNLEAELSKSDKISPDFFSDVTNVIWSPDRNLAIIKQENKTSLYDFKRYDLLHQEIYPFSDGIGNIVWRADGKKILYYYAPEGGETTLIEAEPDNTNKQIVYNFKDTQIRNPAIDWSPDQQDALVIANTKLYIFHFFDKTLKPLLENTAVSEAEFTPDNDIIYQTSDGLHICDKLGQNDWKLEVNTGLDKIYFFDSSTLYYSEKTKGANQFFLFDLAKNQKTEIFYNTKININPADLLVTENQKRLYFESEGYLYFINIETNNYN